MTERTRNWLITGAVLAALAVLIGKGWAERDMFYGWIEPGDDAPGFVLPSLAGEPVSLESLRGQVVLLNVWATWCSPCVWEMPALERLHSELGAEGLEVVAVSVDRAGSDDAVRAFVEEYDLTFTVLRDVEGEIEHRYGVRGLPTTFIIGPEGRVLDRVLGPRPWDEPPHSAQLRERLEG